VVKRFGKIDRVVVDTGEADSVRTTFAARGLDIDVLTRKVSISACLSWTT
jgi:hypothetical protein